MIVPWSPEAEQCRHRTAALLWCAKRWVDQGFLPRLAAEPPGSPWCKARALADAVTSTAADVVVIADADVWCQPWALASSISAVEEGAAWSIPHGHVRRLTAAATGALMADEPWAAYPLDRDPYVGVAGGGLVVIRKDVALDCPMDRRFVGWGGEDHSWGFALATLHGDPHRPIVPPEKGAPLVHLWHPPPDRATIFGSTANRDLRALYWEAMIADDKAAMRELVEEGRAWPSP